MKDKIRSLFWSIRWVVAQNFDVLFYGLFPCNFRCHCWGFVTGRLVWWNIRFPFLFPGAHTTEFLTFESLQDFRLCSRSDPARSAQCWECFTARQMTRSVKVTCSPSTRSRVVHKALHASTSRAIILTLQSSNICSMNFPQLRFMIKSIASCSVLNLDTIYTIGLRAS